MIQSDDGGSEVRVRTVHPIQAVARIFNGEKKRTAGAKHYKSVPQAWTALPDSKFSQVIKHLESVLLEISTDGKNVNLLDGRVSVVTLNRWADHLRMR